MDSFVKRVYDDILAGGLLHKGEHVVIGVSGGADSMCLLYVLRALQPILQLKLTAVHVHHGLRGAAADGDMAFVENVCAAEGIECRSFQVNIREMAAAKQCSEEEAGRMYRYECFEKVRQAAGADKIAVAHHMDDTCETVLMNLFRGSGIKGLTGIPAMRGTIIRPLLRISRVDIEAFLERSGIAYRTDATNFETDYTRNKIRLDVLPYVKAHINTAATEHIAETAILVTDICRYIERQAREAGRTVVRPLGPEGGKSPDEGRQQVADDRAYAIDVQGFHELDIAVQREMLRQVIGEAAGQMKDIGMMHIEAVRQLFDKGAGRRISLPYGLQAVRTYTSVRIEPVQAAADVAGKCDENRGTDVVQIPGRYLVGAGRYLVLSSFSVDKNPQIPKKMYTKWFDYDKIKNRLVLRYRRSGDYMEIRGGCRKPLRRILMDDKIPQADRDAMLLLADGSHILWIPDTGRMSEYYKITGATKRILEAELKEIEDERED